MLRFSFSKVAGCGGAVLLKKTQTRIFSYDFVKFFTPLQDGCFYGKQSIFRSGYVIFPI